MRILPHAQRTPEWYAARLGVPSASNFEKIITPMGKPSTQIEGYINRLIAEKIMGKPCDADEPNAAMQRGTELEPQAREYYSLIAGPVEEVGFCLHDEYDFGCSPDGLVGDGIVEIKCPMPWTHVEYLRDGAMPAKYMPQVQGQLLVTGRPWCDFISFHPDMRPLIVRVEADRKYQATLLHLLVKMLHEINSQSEVLK